MAEEKGTLNVAAAKVDGPEILKNSESILAQLLEKVDMEREADDATFKLIDANLSSEIVGTLRGHFAKNLIYNIPRRSERGKKECRECDLIDGGCTYKKSRTPHIHILGVGYQGALTAMRAYGRLQAVVEEMPEIVEQGDKLYWAAYGMATDRHTGSEIGRWYFEPVMRKAGSRFIENEFGASIAQSKALRNVILALIPSKLMDGWIEDYRDGKSEFNVQTAKDMGYGPEKQPPTKQKQQSAPEKPKDKPTAQTPGGRALASVITELAEIVGREAEELTAFSDSEYETKGQAMLAFNRALNDEDERSELRLKFTEWLKTKGNTEPDPDPPAEAKTEEATGGDATLDNFPDMPPKQMFLAEGEKRFAKIEDFEAWAKRIVSPAPWDEWTDENFEKALPVLLEVPLLAAQKDTDDTGQDNTQEESEKEQEQGTDATEWDVTRQTRKRISELLTELEIYDGPRSPKFKDRIKKLIGRDLLKMQAMMESEGQAIIASLNEELEMIGVEQPDGTGEVVDDDPLNQGGHDQAGTQDADEAWFSSPEYAEQLNAYTIRSTGRFPDVIKSTAFQREHGLTAPSYWLQADFDKGNSLLDKLDAEDKAAATPEEPAKAITEEQKEHIKDIMEEILPTTLNPHLSPNARHWISEAIGYRSPGIAGLSKEEGDKVIEYLAKVEKQRNTKPNVS